MSTSVKRVPNKDNIAEYNGEEQEGVAPFKVKYSTLVHNDSSKD
jgi:hypothetical protein